MTAPTIRDRMLAAGIAPAKADAHLAAGVVRIDGEPARPDQPCPWPTSWTIGPSS